MENYISETLKKIRIQNNLTQSQFAKKLFTSDRTISHYENGTRMPDIDFLNEVCRVFNTPIDYFKKRDNSSESCPRDLIVVKNSKNKSAIFDRNKSEYLTQHIYDRILLSPSGHHIVVKNDDYIDDDGTIRKNAGAINYSAIVDNFGNVTEFSDLVFGTCGPFYEDSCIVASLKTNRGYLANFEGKLISKDYWRVRVVDRENNFGIYYGIERGEKNVNGLYEESSRVLLSQDGEEINLKVEKQEYDIYPQITNLSNAEQAYSYIKKYGPNLLLLLPNEFFKVNANYNLFIKATIEHSLDHLKYTKKNLEFYYAFNLLKQKADVFNDGFVKTELVDKSVFDILADKRMYRIEQNYIKKMICDLFEKINLIWKSLWIINNYDII